MQKTDAEPVAARLAGRTVKVAGLGGIGAWVAWAVTLYLARHLPGEVLWLIDGDSYEPANRDRVVFHVDGDPNKAVVKARELTAACGGRLTILPVPQYIRPANVGRLIGERDVVLACFDNHKSRLCLSRRVSRLEDAVFISGGNDGLEEGRAGTLGNVMLQVRQAGRDVTHPLPRFHPEIARPADRRPDELGCGAVVESSPQLGFTNLLAAALMCAAFHHWLTEAEPGFEEIFFDLQAARATPVSRPVTVCRKPVSARPRPCRS